MIIALFMIWEYFIDILKRILFLTQYIYFSFWWQQNIVNLTIDFQLLGINSSVCFLILFDYTCADNGLHLRLKFKYNSMRLTIRKSKE